MSGSRASSDQPGSLSGGARGIALAVLLGLAPTLGGAPAARAQTEAQARGLAEAVAVLGIQAGMARSAVEICDRRDPSRSGERRAHFEAWAARNRLERYEALVAALIAEEALAKARAQMHDVIGSVLEKDDSICAHIEVFLADDQVDLRAGLEQALRMAREIGLNPEGRPAGATLPAPQGGEVRRLSQFSAEAMEIMARVAPAREEMSDETRDAREARLMEVLEASGGRLTLYGRVTGRDELREWTAEHHSIFEVDCRNFADDRSKALMAASKGQDMVVSGEARRIFDVRSGIRAVLYLNDCKVSTLAAAGSLAPGEPPAEGLSPRPPSEEEAYAGPGKGVALKDVDRVLYDADFTTGLDGFGNLYTNRREDIYVLLKDGTSYRHDWSFPFADLDVALSQRREPEQWGRWSDSGGETTIRAGGESRELKDARRLVALSPETRLDHHYYYLNVGMGGGRSDRGATFHADGRIERSRGGFVAGHVAGGFLTVVGPDEPILKGRYRFEDFALVVRGEDGREDRVFLGVPDDEDLSAPENLVIGGEIYWTKDDE
ncbi:hypothetical protein [Neomegalonema sp.]|uniref:hypothetical protein n=1 Tax=Neomegalonema sp. TaxID=2039713 RepID=UPI0026334662|nr:hypothetical protein [Neomegalonema sp.]MDD2868658.1 hypothetical protein [Neomegalonema sp.]